MVMSGEILTGHELYNGEIHTRPFIRYLGPLSPKRYSLSFSFIIYIGSSFCAAAQLIIPVMKQILNTGCGPHGGGEVLCLPEPAGRHRAFSLQIHFTVYLVIFHIRQIGVVDLYQLFSGAEISG